MTARYANQFREKPPRNVINSHPEIALSTTLSDGKFITVPITLVEEIFATCWFFSVNASVSISCKYLSLI